MKISRYWLRTIGVGACALFVFVCGILMVINERWSGIVGHEGEHVSWSATFGTGAVLVLRSEIPSDVPAGWYTARLKPRGPDDPSFGPYVWTPSVVRRPRLTRAVVPLWMIAAPAGVFGVWACWRARRVAGRCMCGYSLAGLRAGAACPECGAADRGPANQASGSGRGAV